MSLMDGQILQLVERLDRDASTITKIDDLLAKLLPSIEKLHTSRYTTPELQIFLDLQDDFRTNLTNALVEVYRNDEWNAKQVLVANRVLQGLLLVHPALRVVFHRQRNMAAIVKYLGHDDMEVAKSTITTLIHILINDLANFRMFETVGGCRALIRRFDLDRQDQQNLNYKVIEFLLFYLVDEQGGLEALTGAQKLEFFRPDFADIDWLVESLNDMKAELGTIREESK